jgi:hypothetical protein
VGRADAGLHERLQIVCREPRAELDEGPLHEAEVDGADDAPVGVCNLSERAVLHEDRVAVLGGLEPRLEAHLLEEPDDRIDVVLARDRLRQAAIDEVAPPRAPRLLGSLGRILPRGREVAREDLGEEPVAVPLDSRAFLRERLVDEPGASGPNPLLRPDGHQARLREDPQVRAHRVRVQPHPIGELDGVQRLGGGPQHLDDASPARVAERPVQLRIVALHWL